ncbi:hypothetical protein ACVWWG_003857 [Bradyrhizobium sp. LB7.2]
MVATIAAGTTAQYYSKRSEYYPRRRRARWSLDLSDQ